MPTTRQIADTDEGILELVGNEAVLRDTTSGDPVAWRSRSHNGGIAKWSLDAWIGERWIEIGYLFGKRDERPGYDNCAEFEFWHKRPGPGSQDRDYVKSVSIRHDAVILHVPLVTRAGGAPPIDAPPSRVTRFYSDDGQYCYNVQGDNGGHLVKYRVLEGRPESEWPAIAALPL